MNDTTLRDAIEGAWDDGNAMGLDGWVGPGRGEMPDDHAINERRRCVHKAVALIAGLDISGDHDQPPGQPLRTPYPHNTPGGRRE